MWHVVLPLKGSPDAKSRLELPRPQRLAVVRAMAADTLAAVSAAPGVVATTIVSRTPDLGLPTMTTSVAVDVVVQPGWAASLNEALTWFCAEVADPSTPLAVVVADLPALRPESVADVLRQALDHPSVLVDDAEGYGTTVLTARTPDLLQPRFGDRSAAAHRRAGAVLLTASRDARRDIDTMDDLRQGQEIGLGPHTAALIADAERNDEPAGGR
jgi:2-phospho-L-lactate guanylyltransferase